MNKVLLFGGTGNLGRCIASVLKEKNFITTVVTRNKNKSEELKPLVSDVIVTDLSNKEKLIGLSAGYDIIISSLGKSVSPFDKSKTGFRETDYRINADIIDEALESGIGKFVYVSAFHAEHYQDLEYFKVHQDVSDKLMSSGLNFAIIKPPAIYSAFKDAFALAAKGWLVTLGKGDKKTNPIYEGDLARIIVDSIDTENTVVEAGGPEILTRHEINEIIQTEIAPGKKVRHCPLLAIDLFLPLLKTLNRNLYDKVAFFSAVMKEDTVAPQRGKMPFSEYVRLYK